MFVVIALGGNALLERGQPMTEHQQRVNVKRAAKALADVAREQTLVITHGNGPQVGLLALQSAAYTEVEPYPLDALGAQTEGMIGYLIEQELGNLLPYEQHIATLLTMIEVDPNDPAFHKPSKPIGPVYTREQADRLAQERGWAMAPDNERFRRVVPSPLPRHIFEIDAIKLLVNNGVIVICAGGGGIPTAYRPGRILEGVEAVIDKDRAGALLAEELKADAYLMLTDVKAVYTNWGQPDARAIRRTSPEAMDREFLGKEAEQEELPEFTTRRKLILGVFALAFLILIYAVIPWSDLGLPFPTLGWWFGELSALFLLAAVVIGLIAGYRDQELVDTFVQGARDFLTPALIIAVARGVTVIMKNGLITDTVLNSLEGVVAGTGSIAFANLMYIINLPLAFLIPSSSAHATLAMPILAPLADFAKLPRSIVVTSYQSASGLLNLITPTSVIIMGALAVARTGYDRWFRFVRPLLLIVLVASMLLLSLGAFGLGVK